MNLQIQKVPLCISTVIASPFCSICSDVLYTEENRAKTQGDYGSCDLLQPLTMSEILMCLSVPDSKI